LLDLEGNQLTSVPIELSNLSEGVIQQIFNAGITIEGFVPTALDIQNKPLSTNQGIFLPFVTR